MKQAQNNKAANKTKQTALVTISDVLTLILGITGLLYAYFAYDITLVDYKLCFGSIIITGLLFGLLFKRKHKLLPAYVLLYGGIVLGALFFLNNNFTEGTTAKIRPRIIERSASTFNLSKPSVTIDMDSYTKSVSIGESQDRYIAGAANIVLTVDKGLLGYQIIIDKRLTDD
ncbi:hypothetical protein BEL04_16600 [Mucilaginibacter sp. PPCGB 2223]|uniref:hypothetical protein n=1 Tax=Mucilaginibacter sp. PPCGB 2223 TaxID=1886027 RepID=UPI00082415D1|nr:hypothetical protein [Mucilaginibacter sp. PPCGB 2223]OCX51640.1 hypothetical protein BEL04_16600 [Mucilaginibacter sp. PPCGB 2223]